MSNKDWRIGIDVGGTNTDAVVLDENLNLISAVKSPTTEDVMSGIENAMEAVLAGEGVDRSRIGYAMLGTTHCTNAIVERKRLDRVAVIRIGAPATRAIKPMIDWPAELRAAINDQWFLVGGGHEFDGREIAPLDEGELRRIANQVKGECDSVAITSVFSPVDASHETRAAAIMREALGDDFPISISSEIGSVSLLERENATILNAALVDVAKTTSESFIAALAGEDITDAEVYLCQNDGTLMSAEYAMRYPILTIACGPTNSIRGASFLTGLKDAVVVDVGGTTTDLGVLQAGFPRESGVAVTIGGVRTNFRMPDVISIGLGGGSVSSVDTGRYSSGIELNAVQRANAEMQKRAYNVVRALCEEETNPVVSIHDHGSAGHVNCLSELVEECGGLIDMSKLPIGDTTLSAKEIIANESQERMANTKKVFKYRRLTFRTQKIFRTLHAENQIDSSIYILNKN